MDDGRASADEASAEAHHWVVGAEQAHALRGVGELTQSLFPVGQRKSWAAAPAFWDGMSTGTRRLSVPALG